MVSVSVKMAASGDPDGAFRECRDQPARSALGTDGTFPRCSRVCAWMIVCVGTPVLLASVCVGAAAVEVGRLTPFPCFLQTGSVG